jgi:hypothetical protein
MLAAIGLITAGCGSASQLHLRHSSRPVSPAATRRPGPPADAGSVAVIKGWARALRRGDVRAAARYFKIPSVFVNGAGPAITIHSLAQAEAANAALPCGAKFISAARGGPFIHALFRLTGRPGPGGSTCGTGAGQTARTNFIIRSGRITVWLRAPDQPGDNGSPGTGAPATPGPVI